MIETQQLVFESQGPYNLVNITKDITEIVRNGKIEDGVVNVYSHGSTTGVIVLGSEEGLEDDFVNMLKRIVPEGEYIHDSKTSTKNGISHISSALVGTGVNVPFLRRRLQLGMFQQIYFIDFDFVQRERELIIQVMGE